MNDVDKMKHRQTAVVKNQQITHNHLNSMKSPLVQFRATLVMAV